MSNDHNSEHMAWCKKRARDELHQSWKPPGERDPLEKRIANVIASLCSDFGKDPSTASMSQMAFMLGMTVRTEREAIEYIDGFNG